MASSLDQLKATGTVGPFLGFLLNKKAIAKPSRQLCATRGILQVCSDLLNCELGKQSLSLLQRFQNISLKMRLPTRP